jgi:Dyp-type peroxidase family
MSFLPEQAVDQCDLQGNILCGYGNHFPYGLYLFVRVGKERADAEAGRQFLRELLPQVTRAIRSWPLRAKPAEKPPETLNVALSWNGLRAIGVPGRLLATFPKEFQDGMASRASVLGDTLESWDEELKPGTLHLLITVTAQSQTTRDDRMKTLHDRIAQAGSALEAVHEVNAELIEREGEPYAREHFGFADGIGQPSIRGEGLGPWGGRGQGVPTENGWRDMEPGEFVLGYRDEDGDFPDAPPDPLGKNGSYMVVRKLHQNVAAFNKYLDDHAPGDPDGVEELAEKIVGRKRDGTPLVPTGIDPMPEPMDRYKWINDFRYSDDPKGFHCPLGAHTRRANPRDGLHRKKGGELTKRHRIIRRGMPYGRLLENRLKDDKKERGLMFVCYQANIARQFELIQQRWLMDGDPFRLGADRDFLTAPASANGRMTIQGHPPRFLHPQPAFVEMKGGEYFLTPGMSALEALAAGNWA